jgi:hypothetical protein
VTINLGMFVCKKTWFAWFGISAVLSVYGDACVGGNAADSIQRAVRTASQLLHLPLVDVVSP